MPGYEASGWYGVGAPKNTLAAVIERLNKGVNAAIADPRLQARFANLSVAALAGSPVDFARLIAEETRKWGKVIRTANIRPE